MGSLVSRRRRAVRVEAKNVAIQASECGIRELDTTENPAEASDAAVERQKTAVTELDTGGGLLADQENHQVTTIQEVAANENGKKKVKLSKAKIRPRPGKNTLTHGKDCSTQYDFLSVASDVLQPVEDSDVETKSPLSHKNVDNNEASLTAASDDDNSQLEKSETLESAVAEASQSCSTIPFIDETEDLIDTREEVVNCATTHRKNRLLRNFQETCNPVIKMSAAQRVGEIEQILHSQNDNLKSVSNPSNVPQKKTVEHIGDWNPEADLPTVHVHGEGGQEVKLESLEDLNLYQKNGQCCAELMGVAAMTRFASKQQSLPQSSGYKACSNQQTSTEEADKRDLHRETDSAVAESSQLVGLQASVSGPTSDKEDYKDADRCQEDTIVEGKNDYSDGCQNEDDDIFEDTLDWNVDDRVHSPTDMGKEDVNDNGSCHEVIPEGDNTENDGCTEDVIVKAYNNDECSFQESDMAEDTLDTNVDDRVHSPSDPRSDDQESSEGEEDNTVDMLMGCNMTGEFGKAGQRPNSLTTLKDGDSAEGSIYSPPSKSPPLKIPASTETQSPVFKDVAYEKIQCQQQEGQCPIIEPMKATQKGTNTEAESTQDDTRIHEFDPSSCSPMVEHGEQVLSVEACATGDDPKNSHGSETRLAPSDIHDSVPLTEASEVVQNLSLYTIADKEQRLQLKIGQTEDLPKDTSQNVSSSDSKNHVPLKDTINDLKCSGEFTETQRYEDKRDKLPTNLGDSLSFDVGESPKSLLEMQEAEAMTLLLLAGTLPDENSGDVIKGAGDAHSVDVHGADLSDESLQDIGERAGLAAMLDNRPKSSCQLEQLQFGQAENHHSPASYDMQLPTNRQARENDSSAACAPAQNSIHVTAEIDQESDGGSTRSNIAGIRENSQLISHHATHHGAAAASFVEEGMDDGLPSPKRPTSPAAAAASEGDCEMIPLHRVTGQTNLGGSAACASSTYPKVSICSQEIAADIQHSRLETEPNMMVVEVEATATTAAAHPLPDTSFDQQGETAQTSSVLSEENSELQGTSDEMKASMEEPNKKEGTANSVGQRTVATVQMQATTDQSDVSNTQSIESSILNTNPYTSQNDDKATQQ